MLSNLLDFAGEYAIEWLVIMTCGVLMVLAITLHVLISSAWKAMRKARWYRKAYYRVFK